LTSGCDERMRINSMPVYPVAPKISALIIGYSLPTSQDSGR
jgi:hypothetical protein